MTRRLYHADSYRQTFEATLVDKQESAGRVAVELDQSCFYPSVGGQPNDMGWIDQIPVLDVVEKEDRILHYLEEDQLTVGQSVQGRIDWKRRFDHMQQHTGQHILSQSFLQILNSKTVSFHLGIELSTIDLTQETLTPQEIYQVEDLANQIIFDNRPIKTHSTESDQQSQFPLRKHSERQGQIRIVEIADFDWSPCGGTHCLRTGEVGLIKIRRWERAKKRARVEFYCGWRALQDYRWKNRAIYRLSRLYSSTDREVVETAQRQLEREGEHRKRLSQSQQALLELETRQLLQRTEERKGVQVICQILHQDQAERAPELARSISQTGSNRVVLLGVRGDKPGLFFSCSRDLSYDMAAWISAAAPFIEGQGGCQPFQAQAGGAEEAGLERALREALKLL